MVKESCTSLTVLFDMMVNGRWILWREMEGFIDLCICSILIQMLESLLLSMEPIVRICLLQGDLIFTLWENNVHCLFSISLYTFSFN